MRTGKLRKAQHGQQFNRGNMRKIVGVVVLTGLLHMALPSAAGNLPDLTHGRPRTTPDGDEASHRAAEKSFALKREAAIGMAQTGDDQRAARKAVAAVLADPQFSRLSPAQQRDVVSSAAWVEVQSGEYRAAAEFYRRAVALDPSDPDDWNRLSMAEDELGNYDASADAVRRILTDWPHLTDALPAGHIQALIDHLDRNSEARLALMTTLFEANWKREEESASELWYDLAVTLVERGAPEHARTVISRIGWPRPLMRLQADRRFDDLVTSGPEYVATSLAQQIGRLAQLSADNPRNLYTHNEWLEALLQAGRNKDVIDTSGELIDRIAAAPAERPAFHDSDDENFTLAIRSDALLQAGRQDDAVVAMVRASTLTEYGESNVSQKLRLAQLYNGMLRPDDAVDVVEKLSVTAERYSLTKRDTIRMQAALIKGKRQKAETLLERILETGDDTYSLRLGALLRAGRVDEAARIFIERLQDRYKRGDALLMAQKRFEPAPLVGDLDYRRNRDTMLKRNDVMAAIDAVGRVQHYDVW